MSNLPAGAGNNPKAPYNDNTKQCPECGETVTLIKGEWIHWETGEETCEI